MNKVLGIDLGTTNSCMAIMEGGKPTVTPNAEGARTTPSFVAFTKEGECLVGQAAKRQAVTNPRNTIYSAKRLIGRKFDEIKEEAQALPYKVIEGKNGDAWIEYECAGKTEQVAPEQISGKILAKLKADAESYIGSAITEAVITVPAYFNDAQRQATKDAGTIAGLKVERIINEPTAASLAYGLDKKSDEMIAVYDLGGGTYDISILEIGDGVFEVRATNGDTHLGGDNWDNALIEWLADEFKQKERIDLRSDPMALQRLKEEAEKAKVTLSSTQKTDINLPFITANESGPKHLNISILRAKFEEICDALFERTRQPFLDCLRDVEAQQGSSVQIQELVLVGGMTRVPRVKSVARELAGGKPPHEGVNPDEVVAVGAAIQGGILKGEIGDIVLLDVTPLTLGIETAGGISTAMIKRNTTIPAKKSETFSTYSDNQTAVDIKVLQGERSMAQDNKVLGTFRLDGIAPAPRGVPQIEVTFDIDANGILNVSAKDRGTGKDQKITITGSSGLSEEEVKRLREEAEAHAEEDRKKKESVQLHNDLESMVYAAEKQLRESGDKLGDKKAKLENQIVEAKKALETQDDAIKKSAKQTFESLLQEIAQHLYNQADAPAKGPSTDGKGPGAAEGRSSEPKSGDSKKGDNVVEAEIVNEDEDKEK